MENYPVKCKKSKMPVKIEPIIFILLFEIWIYVKSFYYFLYIKVFKDCEKDSSVYREIRLNFYPSHRLKSIFGKFLS